jgi:cytidylate kinase
MIITIDGPAGAGKSTVSRALAQRLGFEFLDTGAMYRAVALAIVRRRIDLADEPSLTRLLEDLRLSMPADGRVLLNGEDVTTAIRSAEVTTMSSVVAVSAPVRLRLAALQREMADGRNVVTEGRDQGTVVFPDAACKFYLSADVAERARRRQQELAARGQEAPLDLVLAALEQRDRRDAGRDLAPMIAADDAVRVDSTGLTPEQVVDRMETEVRRRMAAVPLPEANR